MNYSKSLIVYLIFLIMLLSACSKDNIGTTRKIETPQYTMTLYDYCLGEPFAKAGIKEYYDSCTTLWHMGNYALMSGQIQLPETYQYANFHNREVSDEATQYSYTFVMNDEAYDSLAGPDYNFEGVRKYIYGEIFRELKDFLQVEIKVERKQTVFLHAKVVQPDLLNRFIVSDSLGSNDMGGSGSKLKYKSFIKKKPLHRLLDKFGQVADEIIRYDDIETLYTIEFDYDLEDANDPWETLQRQIRKKLGVVFEKDSADLPYLIISHKQ
ncbi:MAG: hypothetical protein WBA74_26500 [Cyclobacteriaceae bacterium]